MEISRTLFNRLNLYFGFEDCRISCDCLSTSCYYCAMHLQLLFMGHWSRTGLLQSRTIRFAIGYKIKCLPPHHYQSITFPQRARKQPHNRPSSSSQICFSLDNRFIQQQNNFDPVKSVQLSISKIPFGLFAVQSHKVDPFRCVQQSQSRYSHDLFIFQPNHCNTFLSFQLPHRS